MQFPVLVSVLYTAVLFTVAAWQHQLFGTQVWDIGLFEQFSWLIANGKFTTVASLRDIAPLQDHFSLLLLPLGALYRLLPSTFTLIGLQSLAIGSLPAVASWWGQRRGLPPGAIRALVIALVLCPYSFLINRGDFHPDVLTLPAMVLALAEVSQRRRWRYYLGLALTLFAKNAQALFGLGLALYCLARRQFARGLITLGLSMLWWVIATHLSSAGGDHVGLRLGYLGATKPEILVTLLTRPWVVLTVTSPSDVLLYSIGLSLPFLALLRQQAWPALLGAMPIFLTNVISASGIQRELTHHYSVGILAFLIAGSVDSLTNSTDLRRTITRRLSLLTLLLSTGAFFGFSRLAYFQSRYLPRFAESQDFQRVKETVPATASVLTTANYAVHLAGRLKIEQIEKEGFGHPSDFDLMLLPSEGNWINVRGKLRRVGTTAIGEEMRVLIEQATTTGMACSQPNPHIRVCKKTKS